MKHIAKRDYEDLVLKKFIKKHDVLEERYNEEGVGLTEERIKYLVDERGLYKTVEEVQEDNIGETTPVDDIPEGATVVDEVNIIPGKDNEEEAPVVEEDKEENKEEAPVVEEDKEENKEEAPVVEEDKEENKVGDKKAKVSKKNSTKND